MCYGLARSGSLAISTSYEVLRRGTASLKNYAKKSKSNRTNKEGTQDRIKYRRHKRDNSNKETLRHRHKINSKIQYKSSKIKCQKIKSVKKCQK